MSSSVVQCLLIVHFLQVHPLSHFPNLSHFLVINYCPIFMDCLHVQFSQVHPFANFLKFIQIVSIPCIVQFIESIHSPTLLSLSKSSQFLGFFNSTNPSIVPYAFVYCLNSSSLSIVQYPQIHPLSH